MFKIRTLVNGLLPLLYLLYVEAQPDNQSEVSTVLNQPIRDWYC